MMQTDSISWSVVVAFMSLLMLASGSSIADDSPWTLRLSAGASWQVRNDVQIPNNDLGTRYSLDNTVGSGPVSVVRLEVNRMIRDRHGVRILLAPLSYTESTTFDQPVQFAGGNFVEDQSLEATYRFNSWRVGYHYLLKQSDRGSVRIGGTLKVRDAEIRLIQGDTVAFDDDVGLVPLFYLAGNYQVNDRWTIGADLDGLAGGPGRAIDFGLTLDYSLDDRWKIGVDLRLLDGGADTDDVYNFARFSTVAAAISADF